MNAMSRVFRVTEKKSFSASKGFQGGRVGQEWVSLLVSKKRGLKACRFERSWGRASRPFLCSGSQESRGPKGRKKQRQDFCALNQEQSAEQ